MTIFKYIGSANHLVGRNVAICFNSGSLILDAEALCEVRGALARELDDHPEFVRQTPPELVEPKVEPKIEPAIEPAIEPKPKAKRVSKTTPTRRRKG